MYCNNSPGGNFDGISCTNGKIKVSGWACDGDDYTQAVRVHAYVGGKYGEGYYSRKLFADSYGADDPWPVCGGNRNHGFKDVELSGTYTGKQTVYLYGINIGPTGGNTVLSGSPKG